MDPSVKIYRQNKSDEQKQQKSKSKDSSGNNTAYKKGGRDNSNDPSNTALSNKDSKKPSKVNENDFNQYTDGTTALSSSKIQGTAGGSSETGLQTSQLGQGNTNSNGTAATRHLSNKSDTNLNNGQSAAAQNPSTALNVNRAAQNRQASEGRKKRKNSDKRKTSNNRRAENKDANIEKMQTNGMLIPPIDGNTSLPTQSLASVPSHQRSHSRGAAQSQNSHIQAQGVNLENMGQKENNFMPQFFDQASFNPFTSNLSQGSQQSTFNMAMAGSPGFPFNQNGPYNQQAPQVHFIAKKQQFIAQISPEQLMSGDKRPYTAQSLNNLSASTKRAGSVYAGAMVKGSNYNIANAAFANQPVYFGNIGSRTHTNGFSFHPPGGKYSNSIYGEEYKPKVAGKDILKALGSQNGYSSDPYHSIISNSGLPSSITNSGRPVKSKVSGNRLQAKEKEQLYDETIKMKMLNNSLKEDHVKLKTKIKILENELSRKEKTIEELFSHNQLIQNTNKSSNNPNQPMIPVAQTAQKYQQETFLVMSLKKQIRELKYEVLKRDEELEVLRKNIKNTRTQELEQEISTYHMECLRLRQIMEELIKEGQNHPLHQNAFMDRMNQLQMEINQKDMIIKQLSDSITKLESVSSVAGFNNQGSQLAGVRSHDSASFEAHAIEVQGREKSMERKNQLSSVQKDLQKELTKVRKQLREKEKDHLKLKNEMNQLKKENNDKAKNDNQQTKDVEVQIKSLKDKLRDSKNENKRKDERLADSEQRIRKLEEAVKQNNEQIKSFESNTKSLKNQLRAAKHQASLQANNANQTPVANKDLPPAKELKREETQSTVEKVKPNKAPKEEMAVLTLIAQREKLCRDDLTQMMLAGEESLRILIREPSDQLIDFIKANLNDEDTLLSAIPRFEMPKSDFEAQVLREMRIVLRENIEKIVSHSEEELLDFNDFEKFYLALENFDYPHKDKLLEFIKYFFLDHIVSEKKIMMNYLAFKEHMLSRRPIESTPGEKSRNESALRSRKKSQDSSGAMEESVKKILLAGGTEEDKIADEERMLDIAEQCFMRIADLLHILQKTVRQVFLRYSQPEAFKNGSILELMSPSGFLDGIRDIGFDDVTELEAACLMKVLAKPELDNQIILNEFVLIMENFGIPAISEEEEYENDYIPDTDDEKDKEDAKQEQEDTKSEGKQDESKGPEMDDKHKQFVEKKSLKQKNPIEIKFESVEEKGLKILKKLARFLLERYMHPREFFGPTIKKETFGKKKCKVEVIKLHDFYLRLKLASIRKKLKENVSLNLFLAIDGEKFPGFIQVKRMIKALEVVAEGEQALMIKEQEEKEKAEKERIQKLIDDRAAQGLPPFTEEELDALRLPEEEKKKKAQADKKAAEEQPKKGGEMGEILKLGSKNSPKTGAKNKFASSHLGVHMELNTIEEDLHETQTSHYSQQLKEGDGSERGSRHLSNSNNFKGNELEDSNNLSRRSEGGAQGAARQSLPLGVSVNSGDYSGGSYSSTKKGKQVAQELEVNDMDICINDFKQLNNKKSHSVIKEENHEEETTPAAASSRKVDNMADEHEKLQDELDEQVEQKFELLQGSKGEKQAPPQADYEDDYEDDEEFPAPNDLKEDTIKTDQVEQIVDNEDIKKDKLDKEADIEEYSYKDDESKSDNQKKPQAKQDSEEEEDYEF